MSSGHEATEVPVDFGNESPFHGAVDWFDPMIGICGWTVALDRLDDPIMVEAVYCGERIGSALTAVIRPDISKVLGRELHCGFTFAWSNFDSEVVLRLAETGDGPVRFLVGNEGNALGCVHGDITLAQIAEMIPYGPCISHKDGNRDGLSEAIKRKRRIAILASFSNQRFLLSYHRSVINRLATAGYVVILVHSEADTLLREKADTIENLSCLIRRGNRGYDFGSWATGIEVLADDWASIDELLLINDSNFGKVDLILPILDHCDGQFVCLTDSYEHSYHAQSYFMLMRKDALQEGGVLGFFEKYTFPTSKDEVIRHGELGLTRAMLARGIELTPLCPYQRVAGRWMDELPATVERVRRLYHTLGLCGQRPLEKRLEAFANVAEAIVSNRPLNPSHFFWRTLIMRFNHPFIKRELIMKNPANVPDLPLAFMTNEAAHVLDKSEVLQYARFEGGSPMIDLEWRVEGTVEGEGPHIAPMPERGLSGTEYHIA